MKYSGQLTRKSPQTMNIRNAHYQTLLLFIKLITFSTDTDLSFPHPTTQAGCQSTSTPTTAHMI